MEYAGHDNAAQGYQDWTGNVRPDSARNGEYRKPIIHKYMCFVDFKKAFDPFSLGDYDGHGISSTLD